jgi:hypothetical protein
MFGRDMEELAEVGGAGGDGRVSEDELTRFQGAVSQINTQAQKYWALRLNGEATRYQKWSGQSPDGKQRAEFMGNVMPFPFDGASDQRVYWADTLTGEAVRLMIVAAARATVNTLPTVAKKANAAWQAKQVLSWFVRQMGQAWWTALIRCANYAKGDSPAVTAMKVQWRNTRPLEMKRLTVGEMAELYVRLASDEKKVAVGSSSGSGESDGSDESDLSDGADGVGEIEEAGRRFEEAMAAAELDGDTEVADILMSYFDVKAGAAIKAVRELRETGAAEFPVPGEWEERVEVRALRYADDFYMPDGTTDFDRCPLWFEVEWMDKVTLLERVQQDGWSQAWVDEVLKHEGEQSFNEYQISGARIVQTGTDLHAGYYHIVTAHYQAVNAYGLRAPYTCVFHAAVNELTAYGRRVERDSGTVFFAGEVLDNWLLNSRGIPERIGPAAGVLKGMKDDLSDGGRLMALPPITGDGYGNGKEESLSLEPLSYIPLKRGGKLSFMQGLQYPAHMLEAMKGMKEDRDEQFSRAGAAVPQTVSDTATEYEVFRWLGFVQQIYQKAMGLIGDNVSETTLAKITDRNGMPAAPDGRGMMAGKYDVEVVFDARTLDEQRTVGIITALTQLKQSDTENVLNMTPIIKAGTRALDPYHADEALQQGNEGQTREWESERANYIGLRAGIMPQMVDDGTWNYALRLQFYTDLLANNPAAMADLTEDKVELVQQWLEALEFQANQYGANKEIGRTGVRGSGEVR